VIEKDVVFMVVKLKPCPFCGCAYEKDPEDFLWAGDHEDWCPLGNQSKISVYNLCVPDIPEMIAAWNRRVDNETVEFVQNLDLSAYPPEMHKTQIERALIVKNTNYMTGKIHKSFGEHRK